MTKPQLTQFRGIIAGIALLFSAGCASIDREIYDTTKRPPTTSIDIYKDGKMPERKFKEIAELLVVGDRSDELPHQRKLVAEAKRMGGNGLIFFVQPAGSTGGLTVFQGVDWVFRGKVIVYE
jgi:hypothetical protein